MMPSWEVAELSICNMNKTVYTFFTLKIIIQKWWRSSKKSEEQTESNSRLERKSKRGISVCEHKPRCRMKVTEMTDSLYSNAM